MPTACFVSVVLVISPSNGATTIPFAGSIPTPSPRTPEANVVSGISSLAITLPFTGAPTSLGFTGFFYYFLRLLLSMSSM